MTSPFTGGKVSLKHERTTITYRGEHFSCNRYYYVCEDTGIEFTDAKLDDKGLSEIYGQYRNAHGIPSAEDLKSLRKTIGISAKTMSLVLGLGENQYRLYEAGEMPSASIGKMLATLFLPDVLKSYLESSRELLSDKKFISAIAALQRRKSPVYHVIKNDGLHMVSTYAISSSFKESKSKWSETKETVSFNNIGVLDLVM